MMIIKMCWIGAALAMLHLNAFAVLGGDARSVEFDKEKMKAELRQIYGIGNGMAYEMRVPSGTIVREYVSAEGRVFAITWQGPMLPDLRQLLGNYFSQYADAARENHSGHGSLLIQRPGLVLHSGGHMRAFSGRAYLPAIFPKGVALDEIR